MQQAAQLSIHNLKPIESGGVVARNGFIYQDHVAVSFLLELVRNRALEEVWCETHDDITLIWRGEDGQEVEFVQVKQISLGSFWSVAKLCKREKTNGNPGGAASSLLEKSFAHDRCCEPCRFRVVTSLPASSPLKLLALPLVSFDRSKDSDEFGKLIKDVQEKLHGVVSPNDHDVAYWLANTKWEVASPDQVIASNKTILQALIMDRGLYLTSKVFEESIYPQLLAKAQNAAAIEWEIDSNAKHIRRDEMVTWLDGVLNQAQYPLSVSAGKNLEEKMRKAKIADDYILTAQEERRQFRQERLNPKYLDLSDLDLIEGEVLSELQNLRLRLDGGEFTEGTPFLRVCQDKLIALQRALRVKAIPPLFYLDGCMHEIADRCAHRYHKETP